MNIEDLRNYCLLLPYTTEGLPFDEKTLVFKVCNKIFALSNLEGDLFVNLKCMPQKALELREEFSSVIPGYHMNKKHWNTVKLDGSIDDSRIKEWINDSYHLVFASLPKKLKEELKIK